MHLITIITATLLRLSDPAAPPDTREWAWCSAGFDCTHPAPGVVQCKHRCCDTPAHWSMVANCDFVYKCYARETGAPVSCP